MDLYTYIADIPRRRLLAEDLGTDPRYLWQIATGRRQASTDFAKRIELATERLGPESVPKEGLRPDVWAAA